MNKFLIRTALVTALTLSAAAANAADMSMPYKAAPMTGAYDWSGFYAGLHAGYGFSNQNATVDSAIILPQAPLDQHLRGGLGGFQAGYNSQFAPNWVIGLEGDITGTGIHKNTTAELLAFGLPAPFGGTGTADTSINWLASLRGKLGYAAGSWLIYATGGAAWGSLEHTYGFTDSNIFVSTVTSTSTRSGYTAGGGVEYGFARNWTARIEYLYYDLGTENLSQLGSFIIANMPVVYSNTTFSTKLNVVRAGINYRF